MNIFVTIGFLLLVGGIFVAVFFAQDNDGIVSKIHEQDATEQSEEQSGLTDRSLQHTMTIEEKQQQYPRYKEIVDPTGFLNTPEFEIGDLVGKNVILVKFWTFGCINCKRTLPHVKEWYDTYHDDGFEIVSVHTPEFSFEEKRENVEKFVKEQSIVFPVVLDNNYGTWRNYQNRWWPRHFLIDKDGFIVYDHIGEGNYEETEAKIQELLRELNHEE